MFTTSNSACINKYIYIARTYMFALWVYIFFTLIIIIHCKNWMYDNNAFLIYLLCEGMRPKKYNHASSVLYIALDMLFWLVYTKLKLYHSENHGLWLIINMLLKSLDWVCIRDCSCYTIQYAPFVIRFWWRFVVHKSNVIILTIYLYYKQTGASVQEEVL